MKRLTPLGWICLVLVLVGLTVGVCVVAGCGTAPKQEATVTELPPESIGATVQDVGLAMHLWDEFVFSSKHPACSAVVTRNCVTQAERDRVADAMRSYIEARPEGALKSSDPRPAPGAMVYASKELVFAIADAMERESSPEEIQRIAKLARERMR